MSAENFRKKLRNLILIAWNVPPVFGLSFILFIRILSFDQMVGILITPLEPGFIVFWIFFSVWYFNRLTKPIREYLDNPVDELAERAAECIKTFPLHFWGLFLTYLLLAPASVIIAADLYTDFVPQPIDWFRIHLVALIVSIIVGLPIFFLILDLFGRIMGSLPLPRPYVTIKTKVFLIGALIPLLIDTMLVQYFWTRTGYFTSETFIVWLVLELLAIGGSLIFVKSFAQSLNPLEHLSSERRILSQGVIEKLVSQSTDEIGVLTKNYQRLLSDLKIQSEMLELNNRLLSKTGYDISLNQIADMVISLCASAFKADKVFLILFDENTRELVGVAQTSGSYKEEGYFRLDLDDISMAVMVFKAGETMAISDVQTDPRCSPEMRKRFGIQSALASPLIVEGRPIGVLMVVSDRRRYEHTEREITIIEGFAREVGIAIHTHRLNLSRIEAEEKGREHQEHVELLMNSTEEGIYGVDLDGMCTFVNPACLRMLGYDDEKEIIGNNIHELIHHTLPNGKPYPKEECKVRLSTLKGVSGHSADEVHWCKDGSSFPVEYWSHPIRKDGDIVGTVVSFVDISERIQAEKTIKHMAYHDALTGLVNRNEFEVRMADALESVKQEGVQHALLYLDLDQFKVVNDSSGHEAGDELLKLLADIIQKPVPEDGVVARLGGDEFGIILHNCTAEYAEKVANEIIHHIREFRFIWMDKTYSIGASIGIALMDHASLTTGTVLKTADMACYMSKELGRNRVHLFTLGDAELMKRESEMSLVSNIHDALDNDRFVLFEQLIKPTHNSRKDKELYEIFVRMVNEDGSIVPASQFVASAEKYNLMPEIDRWVIRKIFSRADKIKDAENERQYFINLSGTSFNDESFLAFVEEQFTKSDIDPTNICFEVTETAAIANISQAQKFIHAVKKLGCSFALDDFGSGLSSFSYLKELEVNFLKIDGAFTRDILTDQKDLSIVEAITQLGKSMGIQTIAEFVENDEIMQKVTEIGVGYAQGYGIQIPQPWGDGKSMPQIT